MASPPRSSTTRTKPHRRTEEHARLHRRWEGQFPPAGEVLQRDGLGGLETRLDRLTRAIDSAEARSKDLTNIMVAASLGALLSVGISVLTSLWKPEVLVTNGVEQSLAVAQAIGPLVFVSILIVMFIRIDQASRLSDRHWLVWHQRRRQAYVTCLHQRQAQAATRDHQRELALLQRIAERRWWRPQGRARPE